MRKLIKSHWEKVKKSNDLATVFIFDMLKISLFIAVILLAFFFFNWFWSFTVSAQTITRNYSGTLKVRIDGSDAETRPCFIFFPGGGFVSQNWGVDNTWSQMAVDSGYVSCRVGYSTSFFPTSAAAEKGIKDGVTALKYIKSHADEFNIDTNQIYLMGTSAGSFVSMGVAYEYKQNVKGVVNGWGGLLNINYCNYSTVPVFNISTDYDKTVPVNCGNAFGVACCGSGAIYERLLTLGVKTDWLVFEGYKHGLVPKDAGYGQRVKDSFTKALNFFYGTHE